MSGRLLWRSSFLKRCIESLAQKLGGASLVELLTRMVVEEFLGHASISCGVDRCLQTSLRDLNDVQ